MTAEEPNDKEAPKLDFLSHLDYFKIYRDYRMSEQNLLNHRLTWNVAIQAFLFGGYGLTLQKLAEIQSKAGDGQPSPGAQEASSRLHEILTLTPWLGIFLSCCISLAVFGAWCALHELDIQWRILSDKDGLRKTAYIPDPKGGGSGLSVVLGFAPPFLVPLTFIVAWLLVIPKN